MADLPKSPYGDPPTPVRLINRLEPRSRSEDFGGALRAELHDPLWMLTRQWQFGELHGEDTGSAVRAQVRVRTRALSHSRAPGGAPQPYDEATPLEAQVEALPLRWDLRERLRVGQYWAKRLRSLPWGYAQEDRVRVFRELFPLEAPNPADPEAQANPLQARALRLAAGRGIDGGALVEAIRAGRLSQRVSAAGHDLGIQEGQDDSLAAAIDALGADFLAWVDRLVLTPQGGEQRWDTRRLSQRFDVAAKGDADTAVLSARDHDGDLEWHSFELERDPAHPLVTGASAFPSTETRFERPLLTSGLRFPGAPAARWWEIEDGRVNLSRPDPERAGLAQALIADFALTYNNDWFLLPLTLPVGALAEVEELVVTDVFGQQTRVEASGAGEQGWDRFSLFQLSACDAGRPAPESAGLLFIPPTLVDRQQGPVTERVRLLRDEGDNLAWAIESTLPDGLGGGMDGALAGARRREALTTQALVPARVEDPEAPLRYRLRREEQPEHWIPFTPVQLDDSGQVVFARGKLRRVIHGEHVGEITAQSELIGDEGAWRRVLIDEDRLPRAGVQLETRWQRARGPEGQLTLWRGRVKRVGRGEASSGPRFDQLESKGRPE